MTLYPEAQKLTDIERFSRGNIKTYTAGWDTKCGRCGNFILKGEQLVWVRGKGSFHPENPCPTPSEEPEADS